jgi:hypothetical protein
VNRSSDSRAEGHCLRWLIACVVVLTVTLALLMLFLGYGIGGCDRGPGARGVFCRVRDHQLVYVAFATSPLWVTALANLRANMRRHWHELYGDEAAAAPRS